MRASRKALAITAGTTLDRRTLGDDDVDEEAADGLRRVLLGCVS
jgi:hypothetical protein